MAGNKIEHRLFSFITINWRGKPLRSFKERAIASARSSFMALFHLWNARETLPGDAANVIGSPL